MILYELAESLKFFSFVIPANPGLDPGSGMTITGLFTIPSVKALLISPYWVMDTFKLEMKICQNL
jgi:hypothetical protein